MYQNSKWLGRGGGEDSPKCHIRSVGQGLEGADIGHDTPLSVVKIFRKQNERDEKIDIQN